MGRSPKSASAAVAPLRLIAVVLTLVTAGWSAVAGPSRALEGAVAVTRTASAVTSPPMWGPTIRVSGPFYGQRATLWLEPIFMPMTGMSFPPGAVIAVNDDGIYQQSGGGHAYKLSGAFYGTLGTFLTGQVDTRFNAAIFLAVNRSGIFAKPYIPSLDFGFAPSTGPTRMVTSGPYFGSITTAFANVDGSTLDAIAVNRSGLFIKQYLNDQFGETRKWAGPFYGSRGTYFADVNGDAKADAIAVNASGTTVRLSTGMNFAPNGPLARTLTASSRLSFYDITGDGQADAVWFSNSRVYVYPSTGTTFGAARAVTTNAYYGQIMQMVVFYEGGATHPFFVGGLVINRNGNYIRGSDD